MNTRSALLLLAATIAPFASADTIDAVGSGNYTTASIWSNNAAPVSGNNYVIGSGFTPEAAKGSTLAGDGIRVDSGGTLSLLNNTSGAGTDTVPDITLNGGTLQLRMTYNSTGAGNITLAGGSVHVTADSTVLLNSTGRSAGLALSSAISGSSNLAVATGGTATGFLHRLYLSSANSAYSGNWTVSAPIAAVSLTAAAANALGTGTVTVASGARVGMTVANGLDSLADNDYASRLTSLDLDTFAWTNTNAFLDITDTDVRVYLGTQASSIGSLTISGDNIDMGTYNVTRLNALGYGAIFSGTGTLTVNVVPEPATYGLLGAGTLVATAFVRRRRKLG